MPSSPLPLWPLRHLWQWVSALTAPAASAPHDPMAMAPHHASRAEARAPDEGYQDSPHWTMQTREDLAAVIYESLFPSLTWGDATGSAKQSAYASADAVLGVLATLEQQPPRQS